MTAATATQRANQPWGWRVSPHDSGQRRAAAGDEAGGDEEQATPRADLLAGPVEPARRLRPPLGAPVDPRAEPPADQVGGVVAAERAERPAQDHEQQVLLALAGGDAADDHRGLARHDRDDGVEEGDGEDDEQEPPLSRDLVEPVGDVGDDAGQEHCREPIAAAEDGRGANHTVLSPGTTVPSSTPVAVGRDDGVRPAAAATSTGSGPGVARDDDLAPAQHDDVVVGVEQLDARAVEVLAARRDQPAVQAQHRRRRRPPAGRTRTGPSPPAGGATARAVTGGREPVRAVRLRRPRERDAAAVAALALAVGAEERRVLAHLVGQVEHLGQAELLALVEVGGAGQAEQQPGGGAGPPGAQRQVERRRRRCAGSGAGPRLGAGDAPGAEAGDDALGVVVVERERRPVPLREDVLERLGDRPPHRARVPRRHQQVEGEALVELVGPGVLGHQLRVPRGVRLGDHHHVPAGMVGDVPVEDLPPPSPHGVALRAVVGVRVVLAGAERRRVRQAGRLADRVDGVDPEALDAAIGPEPQDVGEQRLDVRVVVIEVGLVRRERAEVPLRVVAADRRPRRAAERGRPVVRRPAVGAAVAEVEPGPRVAARGEARAAWNHGC